MTSMQQSKSLALMFLLGAFLTGGALGFVADRAVFKRTYAREYDRRSMQDEFARELKLSAVQRPVIDSIFDWRNARYQEVRLRIKSPLDSVRDSSRVLINQQLDSSQQHRFKALINSMVARDSVRRARGDIR